MTSAILVGAGAGALHAVTAPDHLLSLGPVAIRAPAHALRLGTLWGVGHGVGTLLLGLPLVLLAPLLHLEAISGVSDRLAGAVLLGTAAWSFYAIRRVPLAGVATTPPDPRAPLFVGFLHGLTGVGALVLMLPLMLSGTLVSAVGFLLAFAVGSTFAMSALTWLMGVVGARLEARVIQVSQVVLLGAATLLGICLLFSG